MRAEVNSFLDIRDVEGTAVGELVGISGGPRSSPTCSVSLNSYPITHEVNSKKICTLQRLYTAFESLTLGVLTVGSAVCSAVQGLTRQQRSLLPANSNYPVARATDRTGGSYRTWERVSGFVATSPADHPRLSRMNIYPSMIEPPMKLLPSIDYVLVAISDRHMPASYRIVENGRANLSLEREWHFENALRRCACPD
ncbi:hypothetical protein AB1N83_010205 [Pleurotus pulmonarius]